MKRCFKCNRLLALDEFYSHPMMADGRLGKCKECTRRDTKANYRARHDYYRAYDRERNQTTERREKRREYAEHHKEAHPDHYSARVAVGNAVRDGKLTRLPCESCGDQRSEAHHHDYSKPLDVRWLCLKHHRIVEGRWAGVSSASS